MPFCLASVNASTLASPRPLRTPKVPGCRCHQTWISAITSPSVRPARCAPITASASPANSYNFSLARRIPAWSARTSASTSYPKETSTCITAHIRATINRSQRLRPPPRRLALSRRGQPSQPIPKPRPSNELGSLASTDVARHCTDPAACARLPSACAEDRSNAGERLRAPTQGRCREGRAATLCRSASVPMLAPPLAFHQLHWRQSAKPIRRIAVGATCRYRSTVTATRSTPKWTFSLSN